MDSLADRLLAWYELNQRDLPWRRSGDPYAIWVSEIMLQQTRVETVIPYYERWMARFPNVRVLARASQQEVLKFWEGLGYYSRARNLHASAQIIVEEYEAQLPPDPEQLKELPGIGEYTAAAIASMAFGLDAPALDGNIRRVYARIFDVSEPLGSPEARRRFRVLARSHLPSGKAGDYNQALMDLGAMICTPRSPNCSACPVNESCQARELEIQELRPVRKVRAEIPHHIVTAAVIRQDNQVLISQRPQNGLLGGLWEFPGGKLESGEHLKAALQREILEELGINIHIEAAIGVFRHAYTHFRVTLHAFSCSVANGTPRALEVDEIRWVQIDQLEEYPMGKIDRDIARQLAAAAP